MNPQHKAMVMESMRVHGTCTVVVDGQSMKPFIRSGDRVTVSTVKKEPKPGMVAAFFIGEQFITHRVLAVVCDRDGKKTAVVAGDSSPGSRGSVPGEEIIGVISSLERGGCVHRAFFRPPFSILALAVSHVLRLAVRLK